MNATTFSPTAMIAWAGIRPTGYARPKESRRRGFDRTDNAGLAESTIGAGHSGLAFRSRTPSHSPTSALRP
jgi:hypothetical protein